MSMFAIYALPQGIPVGDVHLGGIEQPWNAPPYPSCIPVFIASDSEGFFGHQCPDCGKYWRSGTLVRVCPYCRGGGEAFQFLTPAHLAYVTHYTRVLINGMRATEAGQSSKVTIDMDAIVDGAADVPKPDFYHPGIAQQTLFKCVRCNVANDIRGRYGFCSRCGWRNNVADLRAQIEAIRAEMNDGRLVSEEAVKKIISVFDACCRDLAAQLAALPMRPRRRKELLETLFRTDAADVLRRTFDIELLKGMDGDLNFLRMMFQRRHVFEHEGGVATHRYLSESGDTSITEGTLIRETRENAHRLAGCVVRMATNFETGFHEIFPADDQSEIRPA
jgi:hypothetical protein